MISFLWSSELWCRCGLILSDDLFLIFLVRKSSDSRTLLCETLFTTDELLHLNLMYGGLFKEVLWLPSLFFLFISFLHSAFLFSYFYFPEIEIVVQFPDDIIDFLPSFLNWCAQVFSNLMLFFIELESLLFMVDLIP